MSIRFLLVALLLAACGEAASPVTTTTATTTTSVVDTVPTTAASSTTTTPPSTTAAPDVPDELAGFELATIALDGRELLVAVADRGELRRQGLMNVADLGDLDGMLFVFDQDTTGGFWMKDTLLPLDIAFFTVDGALVDRFAMEPCTTADCPTYRPSGAYRYALETMQDQQASMD